MGLSDVCRADSGLELDWIFRVSASGIGTCLFSACGAGTCLERGVFVRDAGGRDGDGANHLEDVRLGRAWGVAFVPDNVGVGGNAGEFSGCAAGAGGECVVSGFRSGDWSEGWQLPIR